jgi:hypothetical protein
MPQINFNIKVITGKRTELEVVCTPMSTNEKILEFKDSDRKLSENKLASHIEKSIKETLQKYAVGQ